MSLVLFIKKRSGNSLSEESYEVSIDQSEPLSSLKRQIAKKCIMFGEFR